jgi:hypothetical protein
MNPPIEQDTYEQVNLYRQKIRTSALTTYDIPRIIDTYRDLNSDKVLRHIAVGNACSWREYDVAYVHYQKYQDLFRF